ncbi:MAG: hypothetical protein DRN04_07535 [Thermoprotei archaeon]|nr:MAG: hypothetical protein DRN04_07535 [Thermoprotei archaeon]
MWDGIKNKWVPVYWWRDLMLNPYFDVLTLIGQIIVVTELLNSAEKKTKEDTKEDKRGSK